MRRSRIRDDLAFFQAVQSRLLKRAPGETRSEEELNNAVRQIVSRAIASEEVVDIFCCSRTEEAGHICAV